MSDLDLKKIEDLLETSLAIKNENVIFIKSKK